MKDLKDLMLGSPRLSLGIAESLTCGHVQARVGAISGSSEFFRGGITAYTVDQKVKHLGVNRAAAQRVYAVSVEIAAQMARGACALFDSDLGIATTGYSEPAPKKGIEEPFAWWALVHVRRRRTVMLRTGRVECPGEARLHVQAIVADAILAELTGYLRELRG